MSGAGCRLYSVDLGFLRLGYRVSGAWTWSGFQARSKDQEILEEGGGAGLSKVVVVVRGHCLVTLSITSY